MSNFINPWFVEGYVDEQDTASAQGCYIGEAALFEGEMAAEKAIQAEREKLFYIRHIKSSIAQLKCELEKCSERHNKKRERIANQIKRLENELKQIE